MNKFKTMTNRLAVMLLLMFSLEVYAITSAEDAIETSSLRIALNSDNTGYVQGKMCEECKMITIPITKGTKAFNHGKQVPLKQAAERSGKYATIFINIEHTMVTRITW